MNRSKRIREMTPEQERAEKKAIKALGPKKARLINREGNFFKHQRAKNEHKMLRTRLIRAGKVKRQEPVTIEQKRIRDESTVDFKEDKEAVDDINEDEFTAYYQGKSPKIIVTTTIKPNKVTNKFAIMMSHVFYNAKYFKRGYNTVKVIMKYAQRYGYTDIVICNDNHKTCTDLYVIHLPIGPSFHFKVFNIINPQQLQDHVRIASWKLPCECLTTGFETRTGIMVARQFNSLFSQKPMFTGRRVVTLHTQRDYIFFRHHIYQFEEAEDQFDKKKGPVKCTIDELGPRFVLKLRTIQKGTMNTINPEYIYHRNIDRTDPNDTHKKRLML
ncbi:brix domain containing protein C4F8.04, putative [Entamoeba invadens IP1]|uniref:brix domain containing protein C4F8.04, putative n=1 Tax=Entamoeba invadens IP1 TaxID=370355 RepID=UPI0002C3EED6|nr:brix domain containing protein C4F8.04, putative [Entamoeba invadens IP1]ELP90748.1 brix domain containing protein C4F8.04, putative [Entamoeba invadens IP1]|eukprot:XP_004257519.1 brix domain containing protein C4F8.04, putative [Entamoeba invadens IP1]